MNFILLKADSFNILLTSLSKSEKRYLELNLSKQYIANELYYIYFQAYQKAIRNKQEHIELPVDFPLNRLPSIKNYLKEKILFSLGKFHQKSTKRNEILEYLKSVEVLFNKRLYKECAILLRKLEKKALHFWSYNLLLEILQWQLRLLLSNGYNGELKISFPDFYKKEKELLYSLNQISFYREIRYKLLKVNSKNKVTNIVDKNYVIEIKNSIFTKETGKLLPYASLEYNRTMSLYYRLISDFEKAFLYSQEEINIWIQNPKIINDRIITSKYINGYINYCELLLFLEAYDLCEKELENLQQNLTNINIQSNNYLRYLTQVHLLKLNLNLTSDNYSNNAILILNIERAFLKKINKQQASEFLYLFAINSFYLKKWKESLYYTNKIINEYRDVDNNDIVCLSEFLRVLIHFEMDNWDVVEHLILRFKFDVPEIELLFSNFDYFKQTLLNKKLLLELLNSLKIELTSHKCNQLSLKCYYTFFINWVENQLALIN